MQHKSSEDQALIKAEQMSSQRYLCFILGGEYYGSPLSSIKEVIKPIGVKPVPYMVKHFKGVINLRGQIVSIVDMREKFALPFNPDAEGIIMVVETEDGLLGAIVDDLVSVQVIENSSIDQSAPIETKVATDYFLGVAKQGELLINLIDLAKSLGSEDFRSMRRVQKIGA